MEKSTLEQLTIELLAERTMTIFDTKELVNWAVKVIEIGYESENLFILAGLDYETTEERECYFSRCVADLELDVEFNKDELLKCYGLMIANKVVRKEIGIEYAFAQMRKVVSASGYDRRYSAFYEIAEDIDCLTYQDTTIFNGELTLKNANEFILEGFTIFVQMELLEIPQEERDQCFCRSCGNFNTPVIKTKYQLRKPFKFPVFVCGLCGATKLQFNSDPKVKWMLIEKFKRATALNL